MVSIIILFFFFFLTGLVVTYERGFSSVIANLFGQDIELNMKHHPAKYLSFYLLDIGNWILSLRPCINTTQNMSLPFLIKSQVNSCLKVTSKIFSFT